MKSVPFFALRRAAAVAVVGAAMSTSAQAQVMVGDPGGGNTAWYTVGASAQPAPLAGLAHAIDVPAGSCVGPKAPCFAVTIDGSVPPSSGAQDLGTDGTEWTGRTAFAVVGAQGRRRVDPGVWLYGGGGIAQTRLDGGTIVDDVRFRIANAHPYPVKVNLWVQLAPAGLQTQLRSYDQLGHIGVTPSYMPFTGRVATTNPDVWLDAATRVRQVYELSASLLTPTPNIGGPLEYTAARLDRDNPAGYGTVRWPAVVPGARLVNVHSGRCLSIEAPANNDAYFLPNLPVTIGHCDDARARTWYVANGGGDQRYLTSGQYGGLCLDLVDGAGTYAAPAAGNQCQPRDSQRWRLSAPDDGGAVRLVNTNSGFCLDVEGHATSVGAKVTQGYCGPHPSQRWRIEGTYY